MLLFLLFKLIVIDFNEVILKYIKIYYSSFFWHIYILKRNYTVKKNLIYTQKHTYLTPIYLEQTIQFYGQ
jgi:hypothetical protein